MKIAEEGSKAFELALKRLNRRGESDSAEVAQTVAKIIADVKRQGDKALFRYTKKFDKTELTKNSVRVGEDEVLTAVKNADPVVAKALKRSARRISDFHKHQVEKSWEIKKDGARLGQKITALQSVGIYVPGGKAVYPSSVLMNAIPAKIAGVKRIVMLSPAPNGKLADNILLAAKIAGVNEIYKVGGAQAVAALAFGTESIAPVDKIVGPGNAYVAEAKRQVFGKVDIDMVAGPSEIVVVADKNADPELIAADLLSQAEHDEMAWPILVTTSRQVAEATFKELRRQAKLLTRAKIVNESLKQNCYALVVKGIKRAIDLADEIAPEHLELMIENADRWAKKIRNAGAIFIGEFTPEALGDYMAGPNHVLPTGGSARFFSPLGVYDFQKRTSILSFDKNSFARLAGDVIAIAEEEQLTAHGKAVEVRVQKLGKKNV